MPIKCAGCRDKEVASKGAFCTPCAIQRAGSGATREQIRALTDPEGKRARNNAKNNARNNAIRKAKNRAEAERAAAERHGEESVLSAEQARAIEQTILQSKPHGP